MDIFWVWRSKPAACAAPLAAAALIAAEIAPSVPDQAQTYSSTRVAIYSRKPKQEPFFLGCN